MKYKELCIELTKLCKHQVNGECNYLKCFMMTDGRNTKPIYFPCNPVKCTAIWYKIKDEGLNEELYEDYLKERNNES